MSLPQATASVAQCVSRCRVSSVQVSAYGVAALQPPAASAATAAGDTAGAAAARLVWHVTYVAMWR
jgi:hypothetical protein